MTSHAHHTHSIGNIQGPRYKLYQKSHRDGFRDNVGSPAEDHEAEGRQHLFANQRLLFQPRDTGFAQAQQKHLARNAERPLQHP